ncbi:M48 family metalloprotease [Reichenbachiella agarivorans]|uniref:M48 family metalloprotease n=1 Tax=Reichenbachiella agarivorans TaxID=2979464 RepID=A0ABY6CTX9_9BACT|nr:M48 family metalloprotease [Reichenbachiella agarivorans]UXP33445.1 M48 family metalloprotease [Reichenbachiella agarivorans]
MKNYLFSLFLFLVFTLPSLSQPLSYDEQLGENGAKQVELVMGIYEDEILTPYVEEIGERLIDHLDNRLFDYQFKIVDEPIPNAFALPGGYIYVTRGLLALVENVDELGCVLSHEVIHVEQRHSVKQMKRSILPALLQVPGMIVGAVAGANVGNIINTPFAVGSSFFTAKYSRKHETEADHLGVALAAKAGFDPKALSKILDRIVVWEEVRSEQEEKRSYFSNHPYTPDRISNLTKSTHNLTWSSNEMQERPILDRLNGLSFSDNPDKGIFVDSVFLHPDIDFSVTFPSSWTYVNTYNAVGAVSKDQNAFVILTLEDTAQSPQKYGSDYMKLLKDKQAQASVKGEKVEVNGHDAFLVLVTEQGDEGSIYTGFVWIKMGENLYKISTVTSGDAKSMIKKAALSLHPLTTQEKELIFRESITIVAAREGESIEKLAIRSDNQLKGKLLKVLNGKAPDSILSQGEKIKVVTREPYFAVPK